MILHSKIKYYFDHCHPSNISAIYLYNFIGENQEKEKVWFLFFIKNKGGKIDKLEFYQYTWYEVYFIFLVRRKMVNTPQSSSNNLSVSLEERRNGMTKAWLYQELSDYYKQNTADSLKKAQQLEDFLKKQNAPSQHELWEKSYLDWKKKLDTMKTDQEAELAKPGLSDADKAKLEAKHEKARSDMLKAFFKADIQSYMWDIQNSLEKMKKEKDSEIDKLKGQLTDIVTEWWPTLKEYFSLSRRRLLNIHTKIKEYKEKTDEYPKNVLVYLMALMKLEIPWISKKIKRVWVKSTWNQRAENLNDQFELFDEWTKDENWDSQWKLALKQLLRTELAEAKKAYVDKIGKGAGVQ